MADPTLSWTGPPRCRKGGHAPALSRLARNTLNVPARGVVSGAMGLSSRILLRICVPAHALRSSCAQSGQPREASGLIAAMQHEFTRLRTVFLCARFA
jgi:hypothetical protein